ncbi:glycosyltransferase family 4 protein [Tenacibaculum sp. 190524A05c]|uniref:glycosyltransferase family 4 protein n=1 Tax=Tenacibaculum platacis TaxID=3137852 RepID=UPI0032B2CAA8
MHCCLAAFYIDNYSYQENILPKLHKIQGHDVKIVASTETYVDNKNLGYIEPSSYINENGIEVTRLPYVSWLPGIIGRKLRKYKGLSKILQQFNPDIVFLHDAQFLSVLEIKSYVKKNPDVKIFADCHTDFINSGRGWVSKNILHKILYKWMIQQIEPHLSKFYGTLPIRCEFLNEVYGVPKSKIELLRLGADDTAYNLDDKESIKNRFRKKYDIPTNSQIIITGGKIDERKKIHWLLEAFKEINREDFFLVVFGVPNQETKELIKPYEKLKNVIFVGWLNSVEIYNTLLAGDLAVYPGTHSVLWEQTVGIGLPCVFKRWKGIEHVDVGGNCIFLETGDVDEIKSVLEELMTNNELLDGLKKESLEKGPSNFAYSEIAKNAIEI